MPGKKKRSQSSELRGGQGFSYEDTVAASFLVALIREEASLGSNGSVVRVAVQQEACGEPMDDLIVDVSLDGELARLGFQVKSTITISEKDPDFKAIINAALQTRAKSSFREGRDAYGFIAGSVGDSRLKSLNRIIYRAKASTTADEFSRRFAPGSESSQSDIGLRKNLRSLIQPVDDDAEWDFYRHFVAFRLDGLEPRGDRLVELGNRLEMMSDLSGTQFVELLCRQVRIGEGTAKVWTRGSLLSDLRSTGTRLQIAPRYAQDLAKLNDYVTGALADIRCDIAGCSIERGRYVVDVQKTQARHVFTNISGLPGCGKSVVLRKCVERAQNNGPVLFLKSDRLEGTSWQSLAKSLGLHHSSVDEILTEIGNTGTPVLFIDGVDRVKPEHRGVITDLLHAIERSPDLRNWRILVTSRDQGLEVLRSWVPASLYAKTGVGDVPIEPLNDDEAGQLAKQHPHLRPLLFGNASVKEVARRPFFAAVLADQVNGQWRQGREAPQTESELIESWWRAGGYNIEPEAADRRQRALLDLAERGATTLGKEIRAKNLESSTIAQLEGLRRDKIIDVVELGSSYKFSHDIFFEWAFFRRLIDCSSDWPQALTAAGEPPLLARIVSLYSQYWLERESGWANWYWELSKQPLRPQWRRAWLVGPPSSTRFTDYIDSFENLLSLDDFRVMEKFLVWYQAERTIPNPLLLQNPHENLVNSASVVRAADQLGWPSDLYAWLRVLTWLLDNLTRFPVKLRPQIVELFSVWQNMFATTANDCSKRIIETADMWLTELESGHAPDWESLESDTLDELANNLRLMIFFAAKIYRDPAIRAIDRVIARPQRSRAVLASVFNLAAVLSRVCPEKLAELVKIEVVEELPKTQWEREHREREEQVARIEELRDRPKADLTEAERRVLSFNYFPLSYREYDFDDLGIDRLHHSFYPPAPGHEPFSSLFQFAPEVALELVRDLANHATTAWCQIHEINPERYGTPIPIEIQFPWGPQQFWGNPKSYAWYFGEGGPQPIEAAYLAMTHWAHQRLDEGMNLEELVHQVVRGHHSVATLGLAVSLALEKPERSPAVLAMIKSQRLWVLDADRQMQEYVRDVDLTHLGLPDSRYMMSENQKNSDLYLKQRNYRNYSLKDLVYQYASSDNESERKEIKASLARFPSELPFELEEQRKDAGMETTMREVAQVWSRFANIENYSLRAVPGYQGLSQPIYTDPDTPKPTSERRAQATRSLGAIAIIKWARKSLISKAIDPEMTVKDAVTFAKKYKLEDLQLLNPNDDTNFQVTCIVATAAVVLGFNSESDDIAWARRVVDCMAAMKEAVPEQAGRFNNNPMDPRYFYIAALKFDVCHDCPGRDSQIRLLTLIADPNRHIAQAACTALFDDKVVPLELMWNAAVLVSELFSNYEFHSHIETDEEGLVDQHRQQALTRAIERVEWIEPFDSALVPPPEAWTLEKGAPKRRIRWNTADEVWTYPRFDFSQSFAEKIIGFFPVEKFGENEILRSQLVAYARALVGWTADRLFPPFVVNEPQNQNSESSSFFKWYRALAGFIARTSIFCPLMESKAFFVEPLLKGRCIDIVEYLRELIDQVVCRYVYDAIEIPPVALEFLNYLLDKVLAEPEFSSSGGRWNRDDQRFLSICDSFLMISVTNSPGATRFANGQWKDLPMVMPLIDQLMLQAGWSNQVMKRFLTLAERAGSCIPINWFCRVVSDSMDADGFRLERWLNQGIPARISGVIQQLAEHQYPLQQEQARDLLLVLDRLVDIGDRRAAALQQSEHFRHIQLQF